MIDDQNVHRKSHGTKHYHQIILFDRQRFVHAQEVKPYSGQHHRDPHGGCDLFTQEQAKNGHQHNIQRGNKARLTGAGPAGNA